MDDKFPTLIGYVVLGLVFAIAPILASLLSLRSSESKPSRLRGSVLAFIAAGVTFACFTTLHIGIPEIFVIAAASVTATWSHRKIDWSSSVAMAFAFGVSITLLWWKRVIVGEGLIVSLPMLGIAFALCAAFARAFIDPPIAKPRKFGLSGISAVCALLILAAFFSFSTGVYQSPTLVSSAWHHWGVYIGPAQLARAGALMMRDVPMQYGMGPTALIVLTCASDWWHGMYYVAGFSAMSFGILMTMTALLVTGVRMGSGRSMLIILTVLSSAYLWSAYPPDLATTLLAPSVSGLRFLPLALLMVAILVADKRPASVWLRLLPHGFWVLGLLWSPESAFQTTFVWCPYYLWTTLSSTLPGRRSLMMLFRLSGILICILLGTLLMFIASYWLFCGELPAMSAYTAYVLYPPGPLPVTWTGAIWYAGLALMAGALVASRELRARQFDSRLRNVVLTLLSAYAALSYFLGRSHDNNLLNISPFFVVMLLATWELAATRALRALTTGLLAPILVFSILFNWQEWADTAHRGEVVSFNPHELIDAFDYLGQPSGVAVSKIIGGSDALNDLSRAIRQVWSTYHEPVTVFDNALLLQTSEAGQPWSAINGPVGFYYLPSTLRREFLVRTARRLKRSGWVIVQKDYPIDAWLTDYEFAYDRDVRLNFGAYYAIRYVPKP